MNRHPSLFSLYRGEIEEISVFGEIVVTDGQKVLFQTSESIGYFPARSCLKPFQFLATELPRVEKYTPCLGSVSATKEQVEKISEWYGSEAEKKRIPFIKFAPCLPMDEGNRVNVKAKGPDLIYSACFSKHMAILESCEKHGWDLRTYHVEEHPYQVRLMTLLAEMLGRRSGFSSVTDGCQIPSPIVTTTELANLYHRLANASEKTPLGETAGLMRKSPEWIGGPTRLDTDLMKVNQGMVAKEGADGLLAIGTPKSSRHPQGLGILIKLMNGYQPQQTAIALAPLLENLGFQCSRTPPPGQTVKYHYTPFKKRTAEFYDVSPTISATTAVWPEDKEFSRNVSFDTLKGQHMTLSSIETTVHLGAHTDAPNHFEKSELGIDRVDLEKYYGPCEVVEVAKKTGVITPKDLGEFKPRTPRVIFKTGSYPNQEKFNTDFVALSPALIEWLSESGVKLVGIDTPSIDPFESKTLDAHHATTKANMGILEGVDLSQCRSGQYTLVALPLKLKDTDASPVRAILIP